ncbi:unnamed protein product, partial [Choristocarpus tenellus]
MLVLVISWRMKAEEMCVYTREEWHQGMLALGVNSTQQLRGKLGALRELVEDRRSETFREFYAYCFDYAKEASKKSIELDLCLSLWDVLLDSQDFPLLEDFPKFLRSRNVPVISKDMWMQILAFFCHAEPDLSNFDCNGGWTV